MNYEKMPFGKYKGCLIEELPTTYIVYALEQFDLPDELDDILKEELCLRLDIWRMTKESIKEEWVGKDEIYDVWRKLSKQYDPANGGTTETFLAINRFFELLVNPKNRLI